MTRRDPGGLAALSPAEMKVMKIAWKLRRAAARDVVAAAREHGWKPSTVKTLLKRLVDKGHLEVTAVGNSFLYEPAAAARPALERAVDSLFEQVHDEMTAPLLLRLVKRSRLTDEELAELRALVDEKQGQKKGRSR